MTRKGTKSQTAVERLLDQQRQFQEWLERLDAEAAGAAPSHVARRVRADYAARLDDVTKELAEHEDGVRQALEEAETRAEGLTKQHADRTDELAEARLRRQVGEFGEDEYEEIAARCKEALADLTKEISVVERDIERYEEILGLIKGVGARKAAAPPPPPPAVEERPALAASEPRGRPSDPGRPRVSQPQMAVDELEFLRSLSDRGGVPAAPAPAPKTEAARLEQERLEQARPAPAAPEPKPEPKPERAPAPAAAAPAAAKSPVRDSDGTTKTLVCTECGTKNLPSEWYCEKCGAELAPY